MSSDLEQRVKELERRLDRARSLPWTMFALMLAVLYSVCVQHIINEHFRSRLRPITHSVELKVDHAE